MVLYGDAPDVHARVLEYCGASRTDPPSAAYVATLPTERKVAAIEQPQNGHTAGARRSAR